MLSIEKSRDILGDSIENLSDEQVREIHDNLYTLVEIILDEYFRERIEQNG